MHRRAWTWLRRHRLSQHVLPSETELELPGHAVCAPRQQHVEGYSAQQEGTSPGRQRRWRLAQRRAFLGLCILWMLGAGLLVGPGGAPASAPQPQAASHSAAWGAGPASAPVRQVGPHEQGPCHPLADGEANPADHDPACLPADPAHCTRLAPGQMGPPSQACLPRYRVALDRPPTAGTDCHPLNDLGEANPYDVDPACQPADPAHCSRLRPEQEGPPNPACLPEYLVALSQPAAPGTDCHPLNSLGEANPADPDPACRPADPAHCTRLPRGVAGPPEPACMPKIPLSQQRQQSSSSTSSTTSSDTSDSSNWVSGVLQELWQAFTGLLSGLWQQVMGWVSSFGFLYYTPPSLSYQHGVVISGWKWSLGMLDGLVVLALVLVGYRLIMRRALGHTDASWADLLPRLALCLVLAHASLFLVAQGIDLTNSMVTELGFHLIGAALGTIHFDLHDPLGTIASGYNLATAPFTVAIFLVVALVMGILISLQRLVFIAALDLDIVLMPLWIFALGLPETRSFGRLGAQMLFSLLLGQVLQVGTLELGAAFVASFGHVSLSPITLLVGLAALYLCFKIPTMLLSRAVSASVGSVHRDASSLGQHIAMVQGFLAA